MPQPGRRKKHTLLITPIVVPPVQDPARLHPHGINDGCGSPYTDNADQITPAEHYSQLRRLGAGAYGTVWLVRSNKTAKLYAQKTIRTITGHVSENEKKAFQAEHKATTLHHENIVEMHAAEIRKDAAVFTMEYMDGGSLEDYMEDAGRNRMTAPLDVLQAIAFQVFMGLQFLHEKGFIHRDIKPGNILLNTGGTVKLADFGLMALMVPEGRKTYVGTVNYMAPERFGGTTLEGTHDEKSDIWAAAITIITMLRGCNPFTGGNPQFMLTDVGVGDHGLQTVDVDLKAPVIPTVEEVDPEARELLIHCLRCDAGERATAGDALTSGWLQDLSLEKSQQKIRRWLRKKRHEADLTPATKTPAAPSPSPTPTTPAVQ